MNMPFSAHFKTPDATSLVVHVFTNAVTAFLQGQCSREWSVLVQVHSVLKGYSPDDALPDYLICLLML